MDAHLKLAAKQDELFARWQLIEAGWHSNQVDAAGRREGWRRVHPGVFTRNQGPLTRRQKLCAATLTAPGTWLHWLSAADLYGFHVWSGEHETVVRAGSGGRRRYPGLIVARSLTLDGDCGFKDGLPVVRPERVVVELAGGLGRGRVGRAFREACRLGCTTPHEIARSLSGQRGSAVLRDLCDRYARIPYHRCRSDAECRALEVLQDAGASMPAVNVGVAGREADLVWRSRRLIVEIQSREFHPFAIDDFDKKARWEAAGYTVRYAWPADIYDHPERLIAICLG